MYDVISLDSLAKLVCVSIAVTTTYRNVVCSNGKEPSAEMSERDTDCTHGMMDGFEDSQPVGRTQFFNVGGVYFLLSGFGDGKGGC